jgi:hypothetical protein
MLLPSGQAWHSLSLRGRIVFEPVRVCVEDDCADGWEDLWLFVFQIATPTASKILKPFGYCNADVEDVVMEVVLSLCVDSHRRLKSFRGESQLELNGWVRAVVSNHARNWLVRHSQVQRGTSFDFESLSTPSNLVDDELIRLLDADERGNGHPRSPVMEREARRLRILAGLEPLPEGISDRTLRRWKRELRQQLENALLKD